MFSARRIFSAHCATRFQEFFLLSIASIALSGDNSAQEALRSANVFLRCIHRRQRKCDWHHRPLPDSRGTLVTLLFRCSSDKIKNTYVQSGNGWGKDLSVLLYTHGFTYLMRFSSNDPVLLLPASLPVLRRLPFCLKSCGLTMCLRLPLVTTLCSEAVRERRHPNFVIGTAPNCFCSFSVLKKPTHTSSLYNNTDWIVAIKCLLLLGLESSNVNH